MTRGPRTLAGRLAIFVSLGLAAIWLVALVATAVVLNGEQDELLDQALRETAHVFLPVLVHDYRQRASSIDGLESGEALADVSEGFDRDESLLYRLIDPDGRVVLRSPGGTNAFFPAGRQQEGYLRTGDYVFYATRPDEDGYSVQVGDPLSERSEAFRESFLTFLIPMLAMLPLAYLLVGWIARTALRPLDELESAIRARHGGQLEPIDTAGQPRELVSITASLNTFMDRLSKMLASERAFATNSAHELRTPVAAALAQAQRLRMETADGPSRARIGEVETALKRLSGVVTRLLQLARADAGVGPGEDPQDLRYLLDIALDETRRNPSRAARLRVTLPDVPVEAPIDPDAFAILVGNLVDNAFLHGSVDGDVTVALDAAGQVSVANQGPVVAPGDLARLTHRFARAPSSVEGFGIGLAICEAISRQAGGELTLHSPTRGRADGFEAVLDFADVVVLPPEVPQARRV